MNQNLIFSGEAYDVEGGKLKPNELSSDSNYLILDTVNTNIDTIGNESEPKKNSMQAMVVGEIREKYRGKPVKQLKEVPGYPESVITSNITIAYAGTNGWKDICVDVREIGLNDKHQNGAFQSALNYAEKIRMKYLGHNFSTTGHSLGGAEAIYVAVLLGWDGFTYGAAGSGLTNEQIKNYTGKIVNLYDTSDIVTSGLLTGGQKKIPFLSIGIDNAGWRTAGHSRDQFKLDKNGNYVNKYGEIVVYSDLNGNISIEQTLLAQQIIANNQTMRAVEEYLGDTKQRSLLFKKLMKENNLLQLQIGSFSKLNKLRAKFKKSGGGISHNEQIYLDDSQALTVVQSASASFSLAMETLLKIYNDGIRDLEKLWQEKHSKALNGASELSYHEVIDVLSSVGCTEQQMVTIPSEYFRKKIDEVNQMNEKFNSLLSRIKAKIADLVQRDSELARELML